MTGVGGTYLCTNPATGTEIDNTDPPVNCDRATVAPLLRRLAPMYAQLQASL